MMLFKCRRCHLPLHLYYIKYMLDKIGTLMTTIMRIFFVMIAVFFGNRPHGAILHDIYLNEDNH